MYEEGLLGYVISLNWYYREVRVGLSILWYIHYMYNKSNHPNYDKQQHLLCPELAPHYLQKIQMI